MASSIQGLPELLAAFDHLPQQVKAAAVRGLARGALIVHRDAIRNAPRSPSMKQNASSRKTNRDTTRQRNPRATSRAKPGGLERSIDVFLDKSNCEAFVFVAANSQAGKYAERIHDKKGSEWSKRGKGTVAKGSRADDKFIERAIKANEYKVSQLIRSEIGKVEL